MAGTGDPNDYLDDTEIRVDESFQNASETLQVFSSTIGGQSANQLSDWVDFSQTATSRQVTALISALTAEEANLPARASAIDLSFSQVVPEPSTALLLMCAGVAFGAGRFRARLPL
jgi:hypothetical protein